MIKCVVKQLQARIHDSVYAVGDSCIIIRHMPSAIRSSVTIDCTDMDMYVLISLVGEVSD